MKTRTLIPIMLLLLLAAPGLADPRLRLVSLLPTPVTVEVANETHSVNPRQTTVAFSPQTGVVDLVVRAKGERLWESRLGVSDAARYTLVAVGSPEAPRPQDIWSSLERYFEGEGTTHKLGYSVQLIVLRDEAYVEPGKSYVRVFHGATGLVPVQLLEGDKTRASADYAQTSSLVPLDPGSHHFTLETEDGHLPLLNMDLPLKEGQMTTVFVAEDQGTGAPYAVSSTVELR